MNKCTLKPFSFQFPDFEEMFELAKEDDSYTNLFDEWYRIFRKDEIKIIAALDEDDPDIDEKTEQAEEDTKNLTIEEIRDYAIGRYDKITNLLERSCAGGTMEIYRVMNIQDLDVFIDDIRKHGRNMYKGKLRGVGIFWAFNPSSAEAHWGQGGKYEIILVGTARCNDISVESTILKYMTTDDEDEITINDDAEIFLKEIHVIGIGKKITRIIEMKCPVFA